MRGAREDRCALLERDDQTCDDTVACGDDAFARRVGRLRPRHSRTRRSRLRGAACRAGRSRRREAAARMPPRSRPADKRPDGRYPRTPSRRPARSPRPSREVSGADGAVEPSDVPHRRKGPRGRLTSHRRSQPTTAGSAARSGCTGTRVGNAPGRNRTYDLALRRRALYPLSYGRRRAKCSPPMVASRRARSRGSSRWSSRETFVIARGARDDADVVRSRSDTSGVAATARRRRSSATTSRPSRRSPTSRRHAALLGDDPFALDEIMARLPAREFAARAALDAALHDLQGKLLGRPVYQLLGLPRVGPPTSWTIWLGDPDDMARRAEKVAGRFKRLKLKLGGRDGLDVERVARCAGRRRAAAGGRQRGVDRSTRRSRRCRGSRRSASSTASSRCPPATRDGAR